MSFVYPAGLWALLALGVAFGGDFSTLNASIAVPPRYLFTMARDGSLPAVFAKLHPKYRTPYVAVITLGVLTVALVATSTLDYIASLLLRHRHGGVPGPASQAARSEAPVQGARHGARRGDQHHHLPGHDDPA